MTTFDEAGALSRPREAPPPPSTKACEVCGEEIPHGARACTKCKAPQDGKDCLLCGVRMPLKALVCGSCKGYQDWRRRIPGDQITLALMVAIFSLVGSLVPLLIEFINLPSQTSGFFLGMAFDPLTKSDERSVLTVRLTNEGGRAALATGGRIAFDLPELASIDLEIVNRNGSVVPPEGSTDVNLFVHGLKLAMPAAERTQEELNSDKEKLAQRLCTATAHLFVGIRERTRIAGTLLPAQELEPIPVPIFTARTWVLERVVGVLDPEKEICP